MKIELTAHAKYRIKERNISISQIRSFIENPDKIEQSQKNPNQILFKKVYFNKRLDKDHLLLIISKIEKDTIKVITIIDTSKISKYL